MSYQRRRLEILEEQIKNARLELRIAERHLDFLTEEREHALKKIFEEERVNQDER